MFTTGLSQADIARLAGVSRSAVANWRVRHADFPQPTGGTRHHPAFDTDAVNHWLTTHLTNDTTPPATAPNDTPPPLAEPLLNLLHKADTHNPGTWLLQEQIVDNGIATAALIRNLTRTGNIERTRIAFPSATRTLVRIPHRDTTIDTHDIAQQANAILAAVGHRVTIHPARDTASNYSLTEITDRGATYTGYRRTRPWTVTITERPEDCAT